MKLKELTSKDLPLARTEGKAGSCDLGSCDLGSEDRMNLSDLRMQLNKSEDGMVACPYEVSEGFRTPCI